MTEVKDEALFFQRALHQFSDLAVDPRQDAIEKLDHGHFRSQAPPDRAELEPDDAGANHDQLFRRRRQAERARRRDDRLLVDLDSGQPRNVGSGRDDDRLRFDRRLLAVGGLDDHRQQPDQGLWCGVADAHGVVHRLR